MTTDEFKTLGADLFGNGWQTRMAKAIGIDGSSVRRWVSGAVPVPPAIAAYMVTLAQRQCARGETVFHRQMVRAPLAVDPAPEAALEWMAKRLVFPGVEQPKPVPAITAVDRDGRIAIALTGNEHDGIHVRDASYVLTRHPDGHHRAGYMRAAAEAGHAAACVTHRFHHYTVIAHAPDGEPRLTYQIATHSGVIRTLLATPKASADVTGSELTALIS